MAVFVPGSVIGDIRGSVGNQTYSRNQGGLYVRARPNVPFEPSEEQLVCQATITALSRYWSAELTEDQRNDWRAYAHQHPQPDQFGHPHLVNGYTRFIQINFHYYRLWDNVHFPDAPSQPPLHPPIFTFTADASADTLDVPVPTSTYDPPFDGIRLYLFGGNDVSPGVNYYGGPWRYVGTNLHDGGWDADPWTIDYPLDLVEGDKVFAKLIIQHDAGGQMSRPFQASAIIEA